VLCWAPTAKKIASNSLSSSSRQISLPTRVALQFHSESKDISNFAVENIARQPIRRNAQRSILRVRARPQKWWPGSPPWQGSMLPSALQVRKPTIATRSLRRGSTRETCDAFPARCLHDRADSPKKTLDIADGHRLVQLPPPARRFARVVAHTATDSWQGVVFLDDIQGLFKPACRGKGHVGLNVDPRGHSSGRH